MGIINEHQIQEVLEQYESRILDPEAFLDQLFDHHPALFQYCYSGVLDPLSDDERAYFFFLVSVIFHVLDQQNALPSIIEIEHILDIEESNWGLFNDQKGAFRDKLDAFFIDYPEEDLLAFIEDSLEVDEGGGIDLAGRELIFVSLKSIIDAIILKS